MHRNKNGLPQDNILWYSFSLHFFLNRCFHEPWICMQMNIQLKAIIRKRLWSPTHVFSILQMLKKMSRVLYNIVVVFIPWEVRIKKIESKSFFCSQLKKKEQNLQTNKHTFIKRSLLIYCTVFNCIYTPCRPTCGSNLTFYHRLFNF